MLGLLSCHRSLPPQALGMLEWDRIELNAMASELIVAIHAVEGDRVARGELILELDPRRARAELQRLVAVAAESEARLAELVRGPRQEEIDQARARLERSESLRWEAGVTQRRVKALVEQKLASAADLDRANTELNTATSDVAANREALDRLLNGTTREELDQARARVAQNAAAVARQELAVSELAVRATRSGRIDNLPYKLGERPPVGGVVVVLLGGDAPFARVYIPESSRIGMAPGQEYPVAIDGLDRRFTGTVRKVSSDPVFTPYFALSERDRARLAFVAELWLLAEEARELPAGVPVQVELTEHAGGD